MAKYRLLVASFIARSPGQPDELLGAGTEIEFEGIPGSGLELVSGKPADELAELRKKATAQKLKFDDKATVSDLRKLLKDKAVATVG